MSEGVREGVSGVVVSGLGWIAHIELIRWPL